MTISNEKCLIDTNILVYSINKSSPFYTTARALVENEERRSNFVIAQQNLLELVSVLTKRYRVPLYEASSSAHIFAKHFEIIAPLGTTWVTFTNLARQLKKHIPPFDIYLAATMLDNGIERIITANTRDFAGLGLKQIIPLI